MHEGLEVRLCPAPDGDEVFILCRSAQRSAKERAMHDRFEKRIEEGLEKIADSCRKRKQKPIAIAQRVGRTAGPEHAGGRCCSRCRSKRPRTARPTSSGRRSSAGAIGRD